MKKRTVLLISGLELEKNTSFSRQLGLLAATLEEKGIMTLLAGPLSSNEKDQSPPVLKDNFGRSYNDISVLIRKTDAMAAVLLGYPDQFPFVNGFSSTVSDNSTEGHRCPDIPFFLWSQFSKPPAERSLDFLIPVPLTETTRSFIISSGYKNPGPVRPGFSFFVRFNYFRFIVRLPEDFDDDDTVREIVRAAVDTTPFNPILPE